MGAWENVGLSNEWYTPKYVFDAMEEFFDLDVAAPKEGPRHTPCDTWNYENSLSKQWHGFVWMNPPFGGRNGLVPWLDAFFSYGNGVALTPDRTSAPWWQSASRSADAVLFVNGKIQFEKPDGTLGKSPGTGTTLFAAGARAINALRRAEENGLGLVFNRLRAS